MNDPFAETKKEEEKGRENDISVSVSQWQEGRNRNAMSSRSFTQSASLSSSQQSIGSNSRPFMNSFPGSSTSSQPQSVSHSEPVQPSRSFLQFTPQPRFEDASLSRSSSINTQEDQLRASLSRQEAVDSLFSNSNASKRMNQIHKQPRRAMSQQESLASLRAQKDKLNPFAFVSSQSPSSSQSSLYSSNCNSSRSVLKSEQPIEDLFKGLAPTNMNDLFSSLNTLTHKNFMNESKQQNPSEQSSNKPVMIPESSQDNPFKTSFDELDNPFGGTGKRPTSERGSNLSSVEDDVVSEIVPSDLDDTIVAVDQLDGDSEKQQPSQSSDSNALASPSEKAKDAKNPKRRSLFSFFRRNSIIEMKNPEDTLQVAERIGVQLPEIEKPEPSKEPSKEPSPKESSPKEAARPPVKAVDIAEFFDNDEEFVVGEDGQRLRVLFDNMLPMVGNNPIIPEPEEMMEQVSCKTEALLTMLASMNLGWRKGAKKKSLEKRIHDVVKEKHSGDIEKDIRVCQK